MDLTFDENAVTMADLEDFEDYVGLTFNDAFDRVPVLDEDGQPKRGAKGRPVMTDRPKTTKALTGLLFMALRQSNPQISIDEVRLSPMGKYDVKIAEPQDPQVPAPDA